MKDQVDGLGRGILPEQHAEFFRSDEGDHARGRAVSLRVPERSSARQPGLPAVLSHAAFGSSRSTKPLHQVGSFRQYRQRRPARDFPGASLHAFTDSDRTGRYRARAATGRHSLSSDSSSPRTCAASCGAAGSRGSLQARGSRNSAGEGARSVARRTAREGVAYHAGLSDAVRAAHREAFWKTRILRCHVAHGHRPLECPLRRPRSEHYQQEAGRAGRDGLRRGMSDLLRQRFRALAPDAEQNGGLPKRVRCC